MRSAIFADVFASLNPSSKSFVSDKRSSTNASRSTVPSATQFSYRFCSSASFTNSASVFSYTFAHPAAPIGESTIPRKNPGFSLASLTPLNTKGRFRKSFTCL